MSLDQFFNPNLEHEETNCFNCGDEHLYIIGVLGYSYDYTRFCSSNCSEEYELRISEKSLQPSFIERQRVNRQFIWGDNGTYPPPELLPDATDDNEGYDVCNDEDED